MRIICTFSDYFSSSSTMKILVIAILPTMFYWWPYSSWWARRASWATPKDKISAFCDCLKTIAAVNFVVFVFMLIGEILRPWPQQSMSHLIDKTCRYFLSTKVWSLSTLVTNSLTDCLTDSCFVNLMYLWMMPTYCLIISQQPFNAAHTCH